MTARGILSRRFDVFSGRRNLNSNYSLMEKLPEELLIEIMRYLDGEELQQASLVCRSWAKIIGSCAVLMKHLPLVINHDSHILEAPNISRTIHKVVLNAAELSNRHLMVMKEHGKEVRELVMRRQMQLDAEIFSGVLRWLPKLRKISLDDVHFNHYNDIADKYQIPTPHLTHVVLNDCHPAIMNFFETSGVVSLKQSNFSDPLISVQLPALRELYLHRKIYLLLEETILIASPMLKKMTIGFFSDTLILSILERVQQSVEELELTDSAGCSQAVLEQIFKHSPKLKQLELSIDRLPDLTSVTLRPMPQVVKLILHSNQSIHVGVNPIIGSLPNVQTLVIDASIDPLNSRDTMAFITLNLPKLEVLEMRQAADGTFVNVTMPSLRQLLIHNLTIGNDGFLSLINCCANIEKLAVESCYSVSGENNLLQPLASRLLKLQEIYLGEGFPFTDTILAHIFEHLTQLRKLTIVDSTIDPSIASKFPRLIVAKKRVDFSQVVDAYAGEDVQFVPDDGEGEYLGSDFDELDLELRDDEDDFYDQQDDLEYFHPDDDENSDDDYLGNVRPA